MLSLSAFAGKSRMAVAVSALLSCVTMISCGVMPNLEQNIIASCVLASVVAFEAFASRPRLRIVAVSAALCACMHSKGICLPYCLAAFGVLFYRSFRSGRHIWLTAACFAVFLLGGIAWSVAASSGSGRTVLFTEDGSRLVPNLVGGAHGLVQTIEGDVGDAFNLEGASPATIVAHCARTVLAHPLVYAKGIVLRAIWLSGRIPVFAPLLVLSVLSFLRRERIRRSPLLFLAASYLFIVHIIMPVEARYFVPVVYLMIACSATFIADTDTGEVFDQVAGRIVHIPYSDGGLQPDRDILRRVACCVAGGSVVLHFAAWAVGMLLLLSFPYRYASFSADDAAGYLGRNPGNVFLAMYPFREGYPLMRDYEGMLELYRGTERQRCPMGVRERWLGWLAGGEGASVADADPECSREIQWQDMLLSTFREIEGGGSLDKGIYDIGTALLTCMLSSGHVRQDSGVSHSGSDRQISDRMAESKAGVCAASYEEFVFDLGESHRGLRHRLLSSEGAYGMMFPERVMELFRERNSPECRECCVSHGGGEAPSRCGMDDYELRHYDQSQRGVVPMYVYNDVSHGGIPIWAIHIYTIYDKMSVARGMERRRRLADSAIRVLESWLRLYDDEIVGKAADDPRMLGLSHFRYRVEAAYNLAKLCYMVGELDKSAGYLLDAIRYGEGVEVRHGLERETLEGIYRGLARRIEKSKDARRTK